MKLEAAIIAGMGGNLIRDIIEESEDVLKSSLCYTSASSKSRSF